MTLKIIAHLSEEYEQMIKLRNDVLLQPSGIPSSYIQPQIENNDIHIGAFENDRLIGCCVLTNRAAGRIQLRQMAVSSDVQGKGIGAAIVAFAEKIAGEKGFKTLFMHARNPVIPFYQKSGYHIVGDEFLEVGIAHHVMEKAL